MPYKVHFVGLVCFYRENGGHHVLLPDGRNPGPGIDPHYGTIIVAPASIEEATGWPESEGQARGIYELPPCSISIEGMEAAGTLDESSHDTKLPHLRDADPNFEIDPARAETIATLRIRRGTLTACAVPGGTAAMSQLEVPHDGAIVVTVTPRDGSPVRTLRLQPGTEILIGNMAERGIYDGVLRSASEEDKHFKIYEKLSVRPVHLETAPPVRALPELPTDHWYFTVKRPINLNTSCSNTGCC